MPRLVHQTEELWRKERVERDIDPERLEVGNELRDPETAAGAFFGNRRQREHPDGPVAAHRSRRSKALAIGPARSAASTHATMTRNGTTAPSGSAGPSRDIARWTSMAVAAVKATVRTLVGGGRVRQPATAAI